MALQNACATMGEISLPFFMKMDFRPAIMEGIGTFLLASVVLVGSHDLLGLIPTALAAGVTLGIFVYVAGSTSGAHINPAVTIALASIHKIDGKQAIAYIVAQLAGAFLALKIFQGFNDFTGDMVASNNGVMFFEAIGTFVLLFGISAVVHGKVDKAATGAAVGGSLLIGIMIAAQASAGVLNPAVALALWSVNPATILGPIAGAIAGVWTFKMLVKA
jgi:glycerol uptake facilitator-like aquaporin